MSKTQQRWLVVTIVVALVAVGAWLVIDANTVGSHSGDSTPIDGPPPAEGMSFSGDTQPAPLAMAASTAQRVYTPPERAYIHHWTGNTKPASMARMVYRADCNWHGQATTDKAWNKNGDAIFSITVKSFWCTSGGEVKDFTTNRSYWIDNHVWVLYRLKNWNEPVHTGRVVTEGRYVYHRESAVFEWCVFGSWGCGLETTNWESQTLRGDGSYSVDWKEGQ